MLSPMVVQAPIGNLCRHSPLPPLFLGKSSLYTHLSFLPSSSSTWNARACEMVQGNEAWTHLRRSGPSPPKRTDTSMPPLLTRKTVVLRSSRRSIYGLSKTDGTLRSSGNKKTARTVLRRGVFVLAWGPVDAPRFHLHFVVRGGARAALFSARDGTQIAEQRVRGRR